MKKIGQGLLANFVIEDALQAVRFIAFVWFSIQRFWRLKYGTLFHGYWMHKGNEHLLTLFQLGCYNN